MILCDIGNTNATFLKDGKISRMSVDEFRRYEPKERVYFICVNDDLFAKLKSNPNFIDLEPYFEIDTIYQGLGIDRIAGCYGITDGVIVDAGSAITVDIMSNSIHLGGYILPGISSMLKAYEGISPRLKLPINSQIDIDALPQKTVDAVSYGILKPIVILLEKLAGNKKVYFTGGDGEFLSKFFKNAVCDKMLVFRSMQKLINNKKEILK
ncbi:type III pantothenate kinase [Campylobacter sp. RM9344]|uniref:Type III pantothenate kinase n=1 Tax=Campylobacter californiensis TaxID=1032243 RepID=A0AAW3ZU79_9BACT|nr:MULTISPECIES: type III pantothenate kinase [unclassified Campylobacter]MBE2985121.1 type III pantothenate kinase [Campylobacter sp. RM6883]MBE2986410.1 type III pantothenate kinase [Campylobacter sp. RM12919]MBE2988718.1 type III pantothenate kinase [Campylobacter sp. RM12920]MBE2995712.1 type III pantothenate kinase [Campylobacter sp. RM6913]MBE3022809.1 type III pantothenate kinase [Campylobacter sp. 7477a]MBE3029996.1 type III pantothenate kinase [Campylobacter sp. RM9344]